MRLKLVSTIHLTLITYVRYISQEDLTEISFIIVNITGLNFELISVSFNTVFYPISWLDRRTLILMIMY